MLLLNMISYNIRDVAKRARLCLEQTVAAFDTLRAMREEFDRRGADRPKGKPSMKSKISGRHD